MANKKIFVTSILNFRNSSSLDYSKEIFKINPEFSSEFTVGSLIPVVYLREDKIPKAESNDDFFGLDDYDVLQIRLCKVIRNFGDEVLLYNMENSVSFSFDLYNDDSIGLIYILLKNWYEKKLLTYKDDYIDGFLEVIDDEFIIENILREFIHYDYGNIKKNIIDFNTIGYLEFIRDYISEDSFKKIESYGIKLDLSNQLRNIDEYDKDYDGYEDLDLIALDDFLINGEFLNEDINNELNDNETINDFTIEQKIKEEFDDIFSFYESREYYNFDRYLLLMEILDIPESEPTILQKRRLNNPLLVKNFDLLRRYLLSYVVEDYLSFDDVMKYKIRYSKNLKDIGNFYKFIVTELTKCDNVNIDEKNKLLDLLKSCIGWYL